MDKRILELDVFRGIAVVAIMLGHYFFLYNHHWGHTFSKPDPRLFIYGACFVMVFFVLSGFFTFLSLTRSRRTKDFILARIARLYPAYWLVVIYTYTLRKIFYLNDIDPSWQDLLVNLTMFQAVLGYKNVDGPLWYLGYEVVFCVLMTALFSLRLHKSPAILIGFFLVYQLVLLFVLNTLGIKITPQIATICLLDRLQQFSIGILFYLIYFSDRRKAIYHILIGCCLYVNYWINEWPLTCWLLFFVVSFYLFVYGKLGFLIIKPLLYLGKISYPLFCVHQATGFIIIKKSYVLNIHPFLGIVTAVAVVVVLASGIHRFIEQPAIIWAKNRIQRINI